MAGPHLEQRAVDGEVLVGQQPVPLDRGEPFRKGGIDGRPMVEYRRSNRGDNRCSAASVIFRIGRSGVTFSAPC
jgi:hypothetical protein